MPEQPVSTAPGVKALAFGRIGVGLGFLVAPAPCLRLSLGAVETGPVTRIVARSVGARDVALGIGLLLADRHDAPLRGWLEAGALADAGDAVATLVGFRHLGRVRAVLAVAAAVSSAAVGRQLVSQLPSS